MIIPRDGDMLQPPTRSTETQRHQQAQIVNDFDGDGTLDVVGNGEPDFRHATRIQRLLDLTFTADAEGRMLTV